MKQAYKEFRFRNSTLQQIAVINKIVNKYLAQGYTLSVRQIYYQLVSQDVIPNTEKSYKKTAHTINEGRLAGLIDWDAIEDRNREVVKRSSWPSGTSIIESAARSFHMDMWETQDERMFVIVEKAALSGVLGGVCHKYDVPLLAARGYPSVSVVREMVTQQMLPNIHQERQQITVLHLGDHDPSGIDMTRDLEERMRLFLGHFDYGFTLKRIALSMEQIEEKDPPPNPAKTSDSRFEDYMTKYGVESWELDALEPSYINDLVTEQIEEHIDMDVWEQRKEEIEEIRGRLNDLAARFESDEDNRKENPDE